jgi:hypothetical protein
MDSLVIETVAGAWHFAHPSLRRKGYFAIGIGTTTASALRASWLLIGTTTHVPRFVFFRDITMLGRRSIISGGRKPPEKSQISTVPSVGKNVMPRAFDQISTLHATQ